MARTDSENYYLDLERDRYTKDCDKRSQDRNERHLEQEAICHERLMNHKEDQRERRKEREDASKTEFEKFKLMMNAFINKQ